MIDLDALQRAAEVAEDLKTGVSMQPATALGLAAELEVAREIVDALHAWESMDGHFFGTTPKEGGDVGRALIAYEQTVERAAKAAGP